VTFKEIQKWLNNVQINSSIISTNHIEEDQQHQRQQNDVKKLYSI
jgi:hypothetical protein